MGAITGTETKSITVRKTIGAINTSEATTLSVMMFGATQAMSKARDFNGNYIWGCGKNYYAALAEIAEVYAAATILSES